MQLAAMNAVFPSRGSLSCVGRAGKSEMAMQEQRFPNIIGVKGQTMNRKVPLLGGICMRSKRCSEPFHLEQFSGTNVQSFLKLDRKQSSHGPSDSTFKHPSYSSATRFRQFSKAAMSGGESYQSQSEKADSLVSEQEEPKAVNGRLGTNVTMEAELQGATKDEGVEGQEKRSEAAMAGTPMERLREIISNITPLVAAKWGITAFAVAGAVALTCFILQRTILTPRALMFASWFFIIWPWPTAIALGAWTLKIAMKQKEKKAREWEQLVLLGGTLTWLILVPCGQFQGFVDGWPLTLFFFYYFFFCISAIVRLRVYGDLSPREEDKQWATKTSRLAQIGFVISVVGGHWLAAWEALLIQPPKPWSGPVAWLLLGTAFVLHWQAAFFLGKYFDRLVVPKTVVTFGPYRWIRHPIYTSYMLLFAGYCVALQSFFSLSFLLAACALYYFRRVALEEELLVENFGDLYREYSGRVTKKFIPYLV